jgi:hypothetical protein
MGEGSGWDAKKCRENHMHGVCIAKQKQTDIAGGMKCQRDEKEKKMMMYDA